MFAGSLYLGGLPYVDDENGRHQPGSVRGALVTCPVVTQPDFSPPFLAIWAPLLGILEGPPSPVPQLILRL
jgi:hypothetical protein